MAIKLYFHDRASWLEARSHDITSTEVSALFGVNPYLSHYQLWHNKKNKIVDSSEPNERMKWGSRLESAIAEGVAEDEGWLITSARGVYLRDETLRMGSSFDYFLGNEGFVEIKNVDSFQFKNEWKAEEDDVIAPRRIELQIQHQFSLSSMGSAYLVPLVGGNKHYAIKRVPHLGTIEDIKKRVADFWLSIEKDQAPEPDFEIDSEFICGLYQHVEEGKIIDLTSDPAVEMFGREHKELGDTIRDLEKKREAIKARLITVLGDAQRAVCNGFKISSNSVAPKRIDYVRKGYRSFALHWPKGDA